MGVGAEIGSSVLLFFLVFGMSATVELKKLRKQLRNRTALLIGLALQFVILPFCGFLVVKIVNPPPVMGITLLVVTSSPGGSYSNWWCSLFNAELSLSITMTAISTLLSTIMLPANLVLYTHWTYSSSVVQSLDWFALFVGIVVVIGGIACGLISSQWTKMNENMSTAKFHRRANLLGNIAGIALITLSLTVSSTGTNSALWDQDLSFYVGCALPFLLGLTVAVLLTSKLDLEKPERVAVAVESSFQNTGIAASVAITMFSNDEEKLARAVSVPLYYGMVEAVGLAIFCIICWKLGWTKAPADENLCVVIYNSYEVEEHETEEAEIAIEVVLGECPGGGNKDTSPNDLIFEQTDDGAYIVDDESLHKARSEDSALRNNDQSLSEEETPTLSSSTLSDGDGVGDDHAEAPAEGPQLQSTDDSEQPSSGTGRGGGGLTRRIAAMKARATGYRRPPAPDGANQQDPRIPHALEDSEDFTVPRAVPAQGLSISAADGVKKPSKRYEPLPVPQSQGEEHVIAATPDNGGSGPKSNKRYDALPLTGSPDEKKSSSSSIPAEGKRIS